MLTIIRKTNDNPHFSEWLNAIVLDNFYCVENLLIIVLVAGSLNTLMGFFLFFRFRWSFGSQILWVMKSFRSE